MSKVVVTGVASLLACAACTADSVQDTGPVEVPADAAVDSGDATPPEVTFQFFLSSADGLATADASGRAVYAVEGDVYLNAAGKGAVQGDYRFDLIAFVDTPAGSDIYYLAPGNDACRTFHLNVWGQIDQLYDAGCPAHRGFDTSTGGLTIQAMPFESIASIIHRDDAGRALYTLRVAKVDQALAEGTSLSFAVEPPPTPDDPPPCDQ